MFTYDKAFLIIYSLKIKRGGGIYVVEEEITKSFLNKDFTNFQAWKLYRAFG